MKNLNLLLFAVISIFSQACGGSKSPSENLPNRNVALDVKVQDVTSPDSAAQTQIEKTGDLISSRSSDAKDERVDPATALVIPHSDFRETPDQTPPALRILSARAQELSELSARAYNELQKKWIGSTEAACNFFVITALCESGYCKTSKPFFKAADFDQYFRAEKWAEVSLSEAKAFLISHAELDLVAQRDGQNGSTMGHIAVPVKVGDQNELWVAQGNYHQSSHQLEVWGDRYAAPFRYFINFANPQ